jgi:hypothetical protein
MFFFPYNIFLESNDALMKFFFIFYLDKTVYVKEIRFSLYFQ